MSVTEYGTLYLVATPIGNLEDITLRALRILKEVDIIACEDTRHSLGLLNHYEIKKPLVSYHKFNETGAADMLINKLRSGLSIAIITDAGTPCISDPGSKIAIAARENGIPVTSIPGPSAVVTACSLMGLEQGFSFFGFLPNDNSDRKKVLTELASSTLPLVFYVAPHDLKKDVTDILNVFGDRDAGLVRELTKVHEEAVFARLSEIDLSSPRGEYVLIVMPGEQSEDPLLSLPVEEHIRTYLGLGYDIKEVAKMISKERDIPRNEAYKLALSIKNGD